MCFAGNPGQVSRGECSCVLVSAEYSIDKSVGRERSSRVFAGVCVCVCVCVCVRVWVEDGGARRVHCFSERQLLRAPENVTKQYPLLGDQSLTLLSPPADATTEPPGEKASALTSAK